MISQQWILFLTLSALVVSALGNCSTYFSTVSNAHASDSDKISAIQNGKRQGCKFSVDRHNDKPNAQGQYLYTLTFTDHSKRQVGFSLSKKKSF